jgi:putative membrane protein
VILRWLVAAAHLLALGLGLGAIVVRARALRPPLDDTALKTVFFADAMWGIAAIVWITTGVWRAFGGLEKGTAYYLGSNAFWIKMSLLICILLLELWPMATLIRWRMVRAKGLAPDLSRASALARISMMQAFLVVAMVLAATAIARGIGV